MRLLFAEFGALAVSLFVSALGRAQIDSQWLAKAKTEGRARHAQYLGNDCLEENVEMRFASSGNATGQKPKRRTIRSTITQMKKMRLMEKTTVTDGEPLSSSSNIYCVNDKYRFALSRTAPSVPFVLMSYSALQPGETIESGGYYAEAFNSLGIVLRAIDGEVGYVLNTLTWDPISSLLKVCLHRNLGTESQPVFRQEEVWLEPQEGWRVLQTIKTGSKERSVLKRTYGNIIEGLSYPIELTEEIKPVGVGNQPTQTIKTTLKLRKANRQSSDFRLSAFGLDEPTELSRSISFHVWLLAIGAMFVGFALAVRIRNRQVSKTTNDGTLRQYTKEY